MIAFTFKHPKAQHAWSNHVERGMSCAEAKDARGRESVVIVESRRLLNHRGPNGEAFKRRSGVEYLLHANVRVAPQQWTGSQHRGAGSGSSAGAEHFCPRRVQAILPVRPTYDL